MVNFFKKNGQFRLNTIEGVDILDTLPVCTYSLGFDRDQGVYFLAPIEGYIIGKVYGSTTNHVDRILNTFNSRPAGTGVLLSGEKGCGKTLLAKMLSIKGLQQDVITIVINEPLCGEEFNKVIQQIKQPAIVIFDEYEKVYQESGQQEALLTLLDGIYPSKKLFILTTNDKWSVDRHMINRPGRLFYNIEYKGLEESFIVEYCKDNLQNQKNLDSILKVYRIFSKFNFDMMKAIVEEMNRYNETAHQAIQIMNIKPEDNEGEYHVTLTKNGVAMKLQDPILRLSPLDKFYVHYVPTINSRKNNNPLKDLLENDDEDGVYDGGHVIVRPSDIYSVSGTTYVYKQGEYTITLKLDEAQVFNIADRMATL